MIYVDYFFNGLLALGGLGHLFGTFKFMKRGTGEFVWSLSGVLAAFLIVMFNLLRIQYPDDLFITLVSLISSLVWIFIVYLFGVSIQNVKDPRVLMHALAAAGLALMSAFALFH